MRKLNLSLIIVLIFLIAVPGNVLSKQKDGNSNRARLSKVADAPKQSIVDINNITTWVSQDGFHDWVVASSWNGAYPKGSAAGAIFAEGIIWGGQVFDGQNPLVRVDGNAYGTGCSPITRLFRVRPDFQNKTVLAEDAASFNNVATGAVTDAMITALQDQYKADWIEWPADKGAMYFDADSNGVYDPDPNGNGIYGEPGEDIPGVPGAAQTLFIMYNDDISAKVYGSAPIGLQVQETYWAYAYTGALGNVIYKKVDLVYKGTPKSAPNSRIDNMYITQWADPDLGTSSDDFAGCDTTLNMGFVYNSKNNDNIYAGIGSAPPAVGYDFLQGVSQFTGNDADSAIYNLKWRHGYKYVNQKPMSSFIYFAAGGQWSDPDENYEGSLQFYNLMRGYQPRPAYPSTPPFPEAVADVTPTGTFLVDGDPVAGTGKLDGNTAGGGDGPGDRRIMVVNGPFTMRLNDTAQVVVALVGGIGTDYLNSVTVMKTNDNTAQIVYDQLFQLPSIPPPDVAVANLDGKVILNWGSNSDLVSKIENFASQGYDFEGYEVFQLKSLSSKVTQTAENSPQDVQSIKIANFDLKNGVTNVIDTVTDAGVLLPRITIKGTNSGIQRSLEITKDAFRNAPLRNGQEYYFAVIAYAFRPNPLLPFHGLESSANLKVAVPQQPSPGTRYSAAIGDTLKGVVHTGPSDGSVVPLVIDPTRTTGQSYKVAFAADGTFMIINTSTGDTLSRNQTIPAADDPRGVDAYPIVDGIQVKVFGPQPDFKGFEEVANASGAHAPTQGTFTFNGSGFPSLFPADQDRPAPDPAGARWGIQSGSNGTDFSYAWFKGRVLRAQNNFGKNLIPYDYEIRFAPGKGQLAFTSGNNVDVPFQIWNIGVGTPNDPSDDFQMIPLINDVNGDEVFDLDSVDHPISGGDNDPETDWIYWYAPADRSPGSVGYNAWVNGGFADAAIGDEVMARMVLVNMNGGSISDPTFPANVNEKMPAPGTVFRIISTKPNSPSDVFTFTAPTVTTSTDAAKADINKINVFPNPYYAFQYRETSRDQKQVTFSHLPAKATIRIFDLSGVLVRTLPDKSPTSQFTNWDLKNDNNYPVASGVYIIHIDMPELGATKVLKLAVVQEEQILKVY